MKLNSGAFAPTTLTGFSLTQHVGGFIELAPDDSDKLLRDTYIASRAEQRASVGTHGMTIWRVVPELEARTGQTSAELSRRFGHMAILLIARHPVLYAQSVLFSWFTFFEAPNVRATKWGPRMPRVVWDCFEAVHILIKAAAFGILGAMLLLKKRARASRVFARVESCSCGICGAVFRAGACRKRRE
jgi:hypothetical protein